MGVLPRFYQQDNEEEVTSEFSDLSLTSQRDEYDEDDYGVTVYNLAECEFPVGLDFEGGSSGVSCEFLYSHTEICSILISKFGKNAIF